MEHELWITTLFNQYFGGIATSVLNAVGMAPKDPAHPWADWMTCEIVVVLFIVALFGFARRLFSVEKPGKLQHTLEVVYEFLHAQAEEAAPHEGPKYMAFFGTLFFFILFMNLLGLIPGFESPTMYIYVTAGLAVPTFLFYNAVGLKTNGAAYLKHFVGPMLLMAPLMIVIEIISHFARPLSLSIRLYANMFAGEQVYLTFLSLTKLIVPAIFIGLHLFVSLLQAYIFTLLAMIYVGQATAHEH